MKKECKRYLIIGLGKTGISCINFLIKKNMKFSVLDTKASDKKINDAKIKYPGININNGSFVKNKDIIFKSDIIVLSPGVNKNNNIIKKAIKNKVEIIGDIELFARNSQKIPIIGITGSNGKSTVSKLLYNISRSSGINSIIGGNIGIPALTLLDKGYELYIIEISSFQLEVTYSLSLILSTVLNISQNHTNRYKTINHYASTKRKIFINSHTVLINKNHNLMGFLRSKIKIILFGLSFPNRNEWGIKKINKDSYIYNGNKKIIKCNDIKMIGSHNVINSMAAASIANYINIKDKYIINELKNFKGLTHRCEIIKMRNKIIWINNSKSTNPASTIEAIAGLSQYIKGKWILIIGGMKTGAKFYKLINIIIQNCKAIILIGELSCSLHKLFSHHIRCYIAKDIKNAVKASDKISSRNDGVLFSPSSPSFDMFYNFEHRGNAFRKEINNL